MKKFSKILILSAVFALPASLSATDAPVEAKSTSVSELARCTINVEGFSASGRCGAVLRAYRRWKEMQ